jgi:FtsP/CotA-like multicopper oxidase with cupredoxin domain
MQKDNPGVWAIHCHNTPHMVMGMMVAIEEASEHIAPEFNLPLID